MNRRLTTALSLLILAVLLLTACGGKTPVSATSVIETAAPAAPTATPTASPPFTATPLELNIAACIRDIQAKMKDPSALEVKKVYTYEKLNQVYVDYLNAGEQGGAIYNNGNTKILEGNGVLGYSFFTMSINLLKDGLSEVDMDRVKLLVAHLDTLPAPSTIPSAPAPTKPEVSAEKQAWFDANKESLKTQTLKAFKPYTDKVTKATTYVVKGREPVYSSTGKKITVDPKFTVDSNGNITFHTNIGFIKRDWIFFEKIIFSVDGQNFTATFGYNETKRDVLWGGIYENATFNTDGALLTPTEYGKSFAGTTTATRMVQLLIDMYKSKETIIRFSGDNGNYDRTLTKADRDAIKQTLVLYACMDDIPVILDELGMIPQE